MRLKKTKKKAKQIDAKGVGRKLIIGPKSQVDASQKKTIREKQIKLTSFDIFERCIRRANNLINIKVTNKEQLKDGYRAAIVLSISALDAYMRTLLISKFGEVLAKKDKPLSKELAEYVKELMSYDKLLDVARSTEFFEKLEKALKNDFEKRSFQGEWRINNFMELVGYKDIFEEISKRANKNKDTLKGDLERFTQRRHLIAHCGDYDLNRVPVSEFDISKEYTMECIKIVELFAKHIKEITL